MLGRIKVSVLGGVLATTSMAVCARPPANFITPQQVVTVLTGKVLKLSSEQVVLLSSVPARTVNPILEVISVTATLRDGMIVKLRCRDSRECLPFFAVVNKISEKQLAVGPHLPLSAVNRLPVTRLVSEPWLVRKGAPATLVLEGEHLRVQIPVICLANGGAGKSIRVTTTNHKQVYRAQVAGVGLLKGGI